MEPTKQPPIIKPTDKQREAWDLVEDKTTTEIGFGGGAGGGKSWFAAEFLVLMCNNYAGTRWILGRKELKNLKRSSLITLFKVFQKYGIKPDRDVRYNQQDSILRFANGSEILLMDMSYMPSDPLYLRFGGIEATGAVVEESNEVTIQAIQILKTRLGRHLNKEHHLKPLLIETFNPDKGHVYHRYYKPWKEGKEEPYRHFIRALVTDNPFLDERYKEGLKKADKVTQERLLYGNFEYDDDPLTLMDTDVISDLFSNTVDPSEEKYMIIDVARFGMDKTVIKLWKGWHNYKTIAIAKNDLKELVEKINELAAQEKIPRSHILADEDGVGGGVVDFAKCKGFVGGSKAFQVLDAETGMLRDSNYLNLRAQCYYALADKVNKHEIAIDCDDDAQKQITIEDLEQIKAKDADKDGKRKVISKEEIKEHLGRSPDFADTLMMRMWFEVNKQPQPGLRWL